MCSFTCREDDYIYQNEFQACRSSYLNEINFILIVSPKREFFFFSYNVLLANFCIIPIRDNQLLNYVFSKNINGRSIHQNTLIAFMHQTDNVEQCSLDVYLNFETIHGPACTDNYLQIKYNIKLTKYTQV